jgi:DMSO/TMAO reductase YedYZ molybdopterin-dependent catalytic subunit
MRITTADAPNAPRPAARTTAGDSGVPRVGRSTAALIGVIAVGITLAGAELLARVAMWLGLTGTAASPFDSLGAAFIVITPEWLKEFGVGLFGQNDKFALAIIMAVTCVLFGVVIGLLGRVREWIAMTLAAALVAAAGVAVVTRPGAGVAELVPLLLGGAAGLGFLHVALRPRRDDALGWGEPPDSRRRALRVIGVGALSAAVAGLLSRLVPATVDVQANRSAVILPPVAGDTTTPPSQSVSTTAPGAAPADRPANLVIPPAIPYGANPNVPDLTPFTTDAKDFYRVDTAFVLPRVPTESWKLTVHGMVQHPLTITWTDLLAMPQVERWITLACVSNEVGGDLVGNAGWQGVRVANLLQRAGPVSGADCVYSTSSDGFTVTTPLDVLTDGRDAMLAIGMNGAPLPIEHGFPVRLVVPGLYGYVSATKWVVDLEVTTFAAATAYWTERGWAPRGPIKTSSRIDTPHDGVSLMPGVGAVAGVAWAQHRGISAVQVRVDDGPWQSATLAGTASADAWVQWVFRWDTATVQPGSHHLTCRAIDGTGAVQIESPMPPAPDGATGYHSIHVVTR